MDPATAFVCQCGEAYHPEHAAARGTCVKCGRPLKAEVPPEKQMVTVQCPTCGDINVVPSTVDLAFTRCSSCAVILKVIPPKYNYLVIAEEPNAAYEWFNSVVRKGAPGLCMSTTFPEKLRREYGLPDIELYWLSDTNPGPRTPLPGPSSPPKPLTWLSLAFRPPAKLSTCTRVSYSPPGGTGSVCAAVSGSRSCGR